MNSEFWGRIKGVFNEVVDLEKPFRESRLRELCGDDAELRREVEVLLDAYDEFDDFIEQPIFSPSSAMSAGEDALKGKMIGRYRIVRVAGRGGMGTVFLATRDDGEFRQEVAIKVVSSAFLGSESLRRFRQERQILAGLSHPNITRLLDGGVTEEGLPYLVMEHIEGESLSEYADREDLDIEGRLRIFVKACRAIAYAHSNLVIHRDIKPTNIMVTRDGEPKLLDFGLAKILDIEDDQLKTATNFRALTPAYASPEQLKGDQITTASDIFSLGVVLYELLAGTRPFHHESTTLRKMIDLVSGYDPPKPSTVAIVKNGPNPGPATRKLRAALRGDIDNIVLTAIRKEPERRYRSVDALADDIERHLNGLPVTAAEDTLYYRTSKFVRRHAIGVVSAAVIVATLIGGIVATTWQARAARRAQVRSETIGSFLQSILGSAAPEASGSDVKVKDILNVAAVRARTELADDPEARAQVLTTLGKTFVSLTLNPQAERELRAAIEACEEAGHDVHPVTAEALAWLAISLAYQNKVDDGVAFAQRSVDISRGLGPGPENEEILGYGLYALSLNFIQKGDPAAALSPALEASDVIRKNLGERHGYYLATLNGIALAYDGLNRTDEAETYYRKTLALGDGLEARYRIYIAQASSFLGRLLIGKERYDEAETSLRFSADVYRETIGPSNTSIAYIKHQLGSIHIHRGENEKAVEELRAGTEMFAAALPANNAYLLDIRDLLGVALMRSGKLREAEDILRDVRREAAGALRPGSPLTAMIDRNLGECLLKKGEFAEAETLLRSALSAQEAAPVPNEKIIGETKNKLFLLYKAWNRPADAARYS